MLLRTIQIANFCHPISHLKPGNARRTCPPVQVWQSGGPSCIMLYIFFFTVWTSWETGPCDSASGTGARIRTRRCLDADSGTDTTGCPGDTCQAIPCSGWVSLSSPNSRKSLNDFSACYIRFQKLCGLWAAQDWHKQWLRVLLGNLSFLVRRQQCHCQTGFYFWRLTYPRFKTKTNIFSKDCLDSCLQDPQCNYALVDLGADLCWKIENPLGFKSDEPGFVAYQCGFGLSEWYTTHAIPILSFCLNFLLQSRLRRFLFDSGKFFFAAPTKVRPRLATNTLAWGSGEACRIGDTMTMASRTLRWFCVHAYIFAQQEMGAQHTFRNRLRT